LAWVSASRALLHRGRPLLKSLRAVHIVLDAYAPFFARHQPRFALERTDELYRSLTDKDRSDLIWAVGQHADYIALSFVRRAEDCAEAKAMIKEAGGTAPLVAKIEKAEAIDHLDAIIAAADGIMVARGDLGVETSVELVPVYQKRIIEKTNTAGKLVITATQMLQSMISNPRPTRAEASDVANAVWDGSDCVMLSNETATGSYPVAAVATMARIIDSAEMGRDSEAEDITKLIGKQSGRVSR